MNFDKSFIMQCALHDCIKNFALGNVFEMTSLEIKNINSLKKKTLPNINLSTSISYAKFKILHLIWKSKYEKTKSKYEKSHALNTGTFSFKKSSSV